jgi:GPI-anchor transamidase subunit GAA1
MHVSPLSVVSPNYRLGLLSAGYLWLFVLPLSQLGIDTYIDENALQPSQVPSAAPPHTIRTDYVYLVYL